MNKNLLIGIVFAGAVLIGIVALAHRQASAPQEPSPVATSTPEALRAPDVTWRFEEAGTGEFDAPLTNVTLTFNGTTHDVGTYTGSCSELSSEQLLPNEASGVLCWWAGAGDEVGVFNENGSYVVRTGSQEEGTAESDGFRGDFKTLISL